MAVVESLGLAEVPRLLGEVVVSLGAPMEPEPRGEVVESVPVLGAAGAA